MKISAIRGAITAAQNNKEEITAASVKLFEQILEQNNLKLKKVLCVIAGSTADITAYYPATALRLDGGCTAPLFSSLEPQIDGGLPLCIRLLVLAKCKNPKHIYLDGAKNLRSNKESQ